LADCDVVGFGDLFIPSLRIGPVEEFETLAFPEHHTNVQHSAVAAYHTGPEGYFSPWIYQYTNDVAIDAVWSLSLVLLDATTVRSLEEV
jgi:hypothetical protein